MNLRLYLPSDRDACVAILESNIPRFFKEGDQAELMAFLDDLPGPYFVIEAPGQGVVGCGGYAIDGDVGHLCWGMVRQDCHGQGLGRLLFDERMRHMRASGMLRSARLSTSQHTTGFYAKYGFATVSTIPDGYGPGLDRCEMTCRFATDAAPTMSK